MSFSRLESGGRITLSIAARAKPIAAMNIHGGSGMGFRRRAVLAATMRNAGTRNAFATAPPPRRKPFQVIARIATPMAMYASRSIELVSAPGRMKQVRVVQRRPALVHVDPEGHPVPW